MDLHFEWRNGDLYAEKPDGTGWTVPRPEVPDGWEDFVEHEMVHALAALIFERLADNEQ